MNSESRCVFTQQVIEFYCILTRLDGFLWPTESWK